MDFGIKDAQLRKSAPMGKKERLALVQRAGNLQQISSRLTVVSDEYRRIAERLRHPQVEPPLSEADHAVVDFAEEKLKQSQTTLMDITRVNMNSKHR